MSAFGLANRLLDKVNSIIQPPTTIFQNDTMPWSVIIVSHNRGRKPCNYYYGILGLDGHTVVVSLTFSTDLVMTFSFLVARNWWTRRWRSCFVCNNHLLENRTWLNRQFFEKEKNCTHWNQPLWLRIITQKTTELTIQDAIKLITFTESLLRSCSKSLLKYWRTSNLLFQDPVKQAYLLLLSFICTLLHSLF